MPPRAGQGKVDAAAPLVAEGGFEFVPLVSESHGRMGPAALRFLGRLGDIAAASGRVSKSGFTRGALQQLSVALCRGNERVYHQGSFAIARAHGRSFVAGADVPSEDP